MSFQNVTFTLSAAVAPGGTFTVGYPAGSDLGTFAYGDGHVLIFGAGANVRLVYPNFGISFGASLITITNPAGGSTLPAGVSGRLELHYPGSTSGPVNGFVNKGTGARVSLAREMIANFGAVDAVSTTAVLATTAVAVATKVVLATPVVLDVPRALTAVSSGADTTQTLTVYGTDEYGAAMSESKALNGTTPVALAKAFKTVTGYQASIALAGNLSIGTSKILGLPFSVPFAGCAIAHVENGVGATAGTIVAGASALATATTGDVRGTWAPNGTPDGTKTFQLIVCVPDASDIGTTQA